MIENSGNEVANEIICQKCFHIFAVEEKDRLGDFSRSMIRDVDNPFILFRRNYKYYFRCPKCGKEVGFQTMYVKENFQLEK